MSQLGIGACSWSIDRGDVLSAIRRAADNHDVKVMQVGIFDEENIGAANVNAIAAESKECGVTISGRVRGFCWH